MNHSLGSSPSRVSGYSDFDSAADMPFGEGHISFRPEKDRLFWIVGMCSMIRAALCQLVAAKRRRLLPQLVFGPVAVNSPLSSVKQYPVSESGRKNAPLPWLNRAKKGATSQRGTSATPLQQRSVTNQTGLRLKKRLVTTGGLEQIKNAYCVSKVLMIETAYFTFYYVNLSESECCMVMPLGHFQPEEHSCVSH